MLYRARNSGQDHR